MRVLELDERKEKILKAIIQTYLETGEPVGSRTISKYTDLNLSSATIRNEMADLEELGYIMQPHTSAGRIPSDKGYRWYVDMLMSQKEQEITEIKADSLVIKRRLNCGMETVETPVPVVVTVNASAPECRPRNAKRVMTCKFALSGSEIAAAPESEAARRAAAKPYLQIVEWAAADVDPDPQQLGLQGSPTKVKKIENVVFQAKEAKKLTSSDEDINSLMVELIASHTLG
mgnify:FL=1